MSLFPAYSARHRSPAAPSLDLSTGGTFARALAVYYQTGSATLALAGSGARIVDDLGDGLGSGLHMNGADTNDNLRYDDIPDAYWFSTGSTVTSGQADPAGGTRASRCQVPSGGSNAIGWSAAVNAPSVPRITATAWLKARASAHAAGSNLYDNGARASTTHAVGTAWERLDLTVTLGGSTDPISWLPIDGRDRSGDSPAGPSAGARDLDLWGCQVTRKGYPFPFIIPTTSAPVACPVSTLSYATGAYPAGFLTNGVVIQFAPDASSAEIAAALEDWHLIANGADGLSPSGATDCVRLIGAGGAVTAELIVGGTIKGTLTITFSRGQALTITAKPSAGTITVAGATTGNGTNGGSGATWTATQTLYIGGNSTGAKNVTGRYVGALLTEAV